MNPNKSDRNWDREIENICLSAYNLGGQEVLHVCNSLNNKGSFIDKRTESLKSLLLFSEVEANQLKN